MTPTQFNLLAIVAVEPEYRVRCQQPHCGHGVYARIHIVEEDGKLLVLGSDCFAKRYGIASTAGFGGFGGGSGRTLTDVERALLSDNTAALLAKFAEEREIEHARVAQEQAQAAAKLEALRKMHAEQQQRFASLTHPGNPDHWERDSRPAEPSVRPQMPLPSWAALKKPNSSFFAYGMDEGVCWVVMQSGVHDGCFIAPAPTPFDSWDEALPTSIGTVDLSRSVYISQMNINALNDWFSRRREKGSRIDSDAVAIQQYALQLATPKAD
jgi:hypothetical protein